MNTPRDHDGLEPDPLRAVRPPRRAVAPHARLWLLAASLFALLLAWRAHFGFCLVMGESMLPSLRSGDLLLVDKRAYQTAAPERDDVVVAHDRGGLIIKRIVGLPGEEVELRQGELYVNRLPLGEDYAIEPGPLSLRSGRLFDDRYALLGDNRSLPGSLVVHAVVTKHQIVGKVIRSLHLWPPWAGLGSVRSAETAALSPEYCSRRDATQTRSAKRDPRSSRDSLQIQTLTVPPDSLHQGIAL